MPRYNDYDNYKHSHSSGGYGLVIGLMELLIFKPIIYLFRSLHKLSKRHLNIK